MRRGTDRFIQVRGKGEKDKIKLLFRWLGAGLAELGGDGKNPAMPAAILQGSRGKKNVGITGIP